MSAVQQNQAKHIDIWY